MGESRGNTCESGARANEPVRPRARHLRLGSAGDKRAATTGMVMLNFKFAMTLTGSCQVETEHVYVSIEAGEGATPAATLTLTLTL